jgi:hypothetical protein
VRRGLILVEGQTEERFIKDVLGPYVHAAADLWLVPTILVTKRVKDGPNFKGGITSYGQVKRDLERLLRDSNADVVTSLIINEGFHTAPSRRIISACPGYQKALHGPVAVESIGIANVRVQCPHFDAWCRALGCP